MLLSDEMINVYDDLCVNEVNSYHENGSTKSIVMYNDTMGMR